MRLASSRRFELRHLGDILTDIAAPLNKGRKFTDARFRALDRACRARVVRIMAQLVNPSPESGQRRTRKFFAPRVRQIIPCNGASVIEQRTQDHRRLGGPNTTFALLEPIVGRPRDSDRHRIRDMNSGLDAALDFVAVSIGVLT